MKLTKRTILILIAIVAVLASAFFWGGSPGAGGDAGAEIPTVSGQPTPTPTSTATSTPTPTPTPSEPGATPDVSARPDPAPEQTPQATPTQSAATTPEPTPSDTQTGGSLQGKDEYNTDPVPEGKPKPVEPEDVSVSDAAYTCTLSIRCDTLLANLGALDAQKVELVPEDGVIFAQATVTFYEGESVFNVLQRELKSAKLHMEYSSTPLYNSAYIEGIANLYEFDCGELSGWVYRVNGWAPNYGCSRYALQDGDVIEWVFTCDLGRDVGAYTGG